MKISAHQGGVIRIGEVEEDSWPPNKQGLTCVASLNGSSELGGVLSASSEASGHNTSSDAQQGQGPTWAAP